MARKNCFENDLCRLYTTAERSSFILIDCQSPITSGLKIDENY